MRRGLVREITESLRRKNYIELGFQKRLRERGPQSLLEQIIAENFPNLGKETGIQIQEIERTPHPKSIKIVQHLDIQQ